MRITAVTALGTGLVVLAARAFGAPDPARRAAAAQTAATEKGNPLIAISGTGLRTADLERAVRFYRDGLGLVEIRRFQTARWTRRSWGSVPARPRRRSSCSSRDPKAPTSTAAPQDKIILAFADVTALAARLKAAATLPARSSTMRHTA